jgi:hypothetical protein
LSSSTRGINAGGYGGSMLNVIEYVTIATTGNASDFGDLTVARWQFSGAAGTSKGVFGGGSDSSFAATNTIDYIVISSAGDASDFGDLTSARSSVSACSNGHGGLS